MQCAHCSDLRGKKLKWENKLIVKGLLLVRQTTFLFFFCFYVWLHFGKLVQLIVNQLGNSFIVISLLLLALDWSSNWISSLVQPFFFSVFLLLILADWLASFATNHAPRHQVLIFLFCFCFASKKRLWNKLIIVVCLH